MEFKKCLPAILLAESKEDQLTYARVIMKAVRLLRDSGEKELSKIIDQITVLVNRRK